MGYGSGMAERLSRFSRGSRLFVTHRTLKGYGAGIQGFGLAAACHGGDHVGAEAGQRVGGPEVGELEVEPLHPAGLEVRERARDVGGRAGDQATPAAEAALR